MAEDRTTSVAKDVELESYKPGPLDEQEDLSETFRVPAIRDYYEPNYANDNATGSEQGSQSGQDHAPNAEPDLRPKDEYAKAVDREHFEDRQAELRERSDYLSDGYAEAMSDELDADGAADQAQGKERDHGQDMGM